MNNWLDFESRHVWHPYASMLNPTPVYPVRSAAGVELEFEDGRRVIDGMSSWWCAIHGYNVPELNAAATEQLSKMSHVMFGGLTHKPAAELAEKLLALAPANMAHVFFADSGSVSVEVAMKMALQYWQAKGKPEKNRLLSLCGAYHGDTFGAMSVCDPVNGMHHLFADVLPRQLFAEAPTVSSDDDWDESQLASFKSAISIHKDELAAVILEPIVQGAGGMRFYAPEFLRQVRRLCDEYGLLLIADEIATGFGRTGTMFACEQAGIQPDILCVGKALTGGYLSLAATLTSAEVCEGLHADAKDNDNAGVLMHGPTFMANPLACAIAIASIDLLLASPWKESVAAIEEQLKEELEPCREMASVADVRCMGAIGVLEMKEAIDVPRIQESLIEQGVWLRPFGKLLYTMPPFVIRPEQLSRITSAMRDCCS